MIDTTLKIYFLIHQEDDHECYNKNLNKGDWTNASVKIKFSYPDPFKVTVHYKIPRHYVMQVLMHMKATKTELNIYATVGSNSVTFTECQYPAGLSRDIWIGHASIMTRYILHNPKKVNELPQEFNDLLDNYIETDTFLIFELPIIHGKEGDIVTPKHSIHTISMA